MKIRYHFPGTLRRTEPWQYALPCICVLFLGALTMMIRSRSGAAGVGGENLDAYIRFMAALAAAVLAGSAWSILADANMLGMICAAAVLLGTGGSYQFLFSGFGAFAESALLALAAFLAAFVLWRQMRVLGNFWFAVLVCVILALLAVNLVLGEDVGNGARIRVPIPGTSKYFQPGEFIKVLLVPLCASSHRSRIRGGIYCAAALLSCAVMLVIHDFGSAMVIFAMLLLAFYLLFDNRSLTLAIIGAAVLLFFLAVNSIGYARERLANWGRAMTPGGNSQQHAYISAVLFGGVGGLGLEKAHVMTDAYAARHDGALAGIMAVFGVPLVTVVMAAYTYLASLTTRNRSIHPAGYLTLSQMSMYVFCSVLLNFCGAMDVLPFTGLVAPLVSFGMNAMVAFAALLGMAAAALYPAVREAKEESLCVPKN